MVALRPMSAGEFQRYLKSAIPEYARAHVRAGDVDPKKALAKARAEYRGLLPKGVATRGQYLYAIIADAKAIGMLWFEVHRRHGRRKAYLFDIRLDKAQRGKGFGRHNLVARGLYESCGYECRHVNMTKELR
jgi:GNAT superfamily N-acetyltransferase